MEEILITENVIISDLLLTDPALLLHLLVTLGTAREVITHKEHLRQLHRAELASEAGLVVELAQGKETIISQGLQAGGTLLLKIYSTVNKGFHIFVTERLERLSKIDFKF